jgi:uncharacterized membrane protein YoaK (UPF0700 family)
MPGSPSPNSLSAAALRGWTDHRRALVLGLTTTAGWLDCLAWLHLGKVFLSFMTGNLLFLGLAAGTGQAGLLGRAAVALAAFSAGTVIGSRLTGGRVLAGVRAGGMERTLRLEAGVLLLFAAAWLAVGDPAGRTAASFLLIVIGAVAMGLQAAVALAWHVPNVVTVAMTGTIAQLAALVGWSRSGGQSSAVAGAPPAALMVQLLLAYVIAAIIVASLPATRVLALGPVILLSLTLLVDRRVSAGLLEPRPRAARSPS